MNEFASILSRNIFELMYLCIHSFLRYNRNDIKRVALRDKADVVRVKCRLIMLKKSNNTKTCDGFYIQW